MDPKKHLTELQYKVTQEGATERAFTGEYVHTKDPGQYLCVCCHTPLFASRTKYDSGSGWPSFYDVEPNAVEYKEDHKLAVERIEIVCKKCKAHLGHVFDDGPEPTGTRYCVNSASLKLKRETDT